MPKTRIADTHCGGGGVLAAGNVLLAVLLDEILDTNKTKKDRD
jgi:DMSO/TMAO reductase YedYZ molybdopterin-dependent catalytic subunit